MKRIISFILSAIMVLTMLPAVSVQAATNPDYVIDDNDYVAGTDSYVERIVETNRYRETLVEFTPKKDGIYSFMLGTEGIDFDKENTDMLSMTLYLDGELLADGEQYFDETEADDTSVEVCEIDAYCLAGNTYYIGIDTLPEGENEVGLMIWRYETVSDVQFIPAKAYEFIENTEVYPGFNEGDRLVIHGEENTYIYTYQKELFFGSFYEEYYIGGEKRQGAPLTDRFSAEPELLPEFDENENFIGSLIFRFFGIEQPIDVTTVESPVKSIQYTTPKPLILVEGGIESDYDIDDHYYYDYERYEMFGCLGDELTICYKDGTEETYYCGLYTLEEIFALLGMEFPEDLADIEDAYIVADEAEEDLDDVLFGDEFYIPLFINENEEFLNLEYVNFYDNQLEQPWKIGTNYFYVNYMGVECAVPVKVIAPGWYKADGHWYYYEEDGMVYDWQKIDGKWYYFSPYEINEGQMVTGWQHIDGKWYYFNSSGAMQTGWQKIGGKWYYFKASGVMQTGWQKIGGKWYYLNASGDMATGWKKIGGKWYYFASSGAMLTGWQKMNNKWYYFNASGAMLSGWQKISGKWYYLESTGAMRTASLKQGGKTYYFNSSGICTNP